VQPLTHFQEDYGLRADGEEEYDEDFDDGEDGTDESGGGSEGDRDL